MADHLDLTHEDYRIFVKHCRECNSTNEIKTYIDKKISKYYPENDDIVICLKEKIEELDIYDEYDLDDEHPYYKMDVINFRIDKPEEKDLQLKYLYSYLCYLSDNVDEFYKIVGAPSEILTPDPTKTFKTKIKKKQLEDLFQFLTSHINPYLEKKSQEEFYKIFGAVDLNTVKPIKWLSQYKKEINISLLFELIKHLCKHEYLDAPLKTSFYEKIGNCFSDKNGHELNLDNVRSNFSKWKRKTYTEQCLETNDYRNENFVLLIYLKENNLLNLGQ